MSSLDSGSVHEVIHGQRLPLATRPHDLGQRQNQGTKILAHTALQCPDTKDK
jgi:hypothetical protein